MGFLTRLPLDDLFPACRAVNVGGFARGVVATLRVVDGTAGATGTLLIRDFVSFGFFGFFVGFFVAGLSSPVSPSCFPSSILFDELVLPSWPPACFPSSTFFDIFLLLTLWRPAFFGFFCCSSGFVGFVALNMSLV